jgi:hypothetical protein
MFHHVSILGRIYKREMELKIVCQALSYLIFSILVGEKEVQRTWKITMSGKVLILKILEQIT